jgi:hypothetical protein
MLPKQGSLLFGMAQFDRPCGRIDRYVEDGDTIELGEQRFRFLSTPGHTPGQGCYYDDKYIFSGDTLFAGSIGRTDFPLSDPELMTQSLRRLLELPGHLIVCSGHGPATTLEESCAATRFWIICAASGVAELRLRHGARTPLGLKRRRSSADVRTARDERQCSHRHLLQLHRPDAARRQHRTSPGRLGHRLLRRARLPDLSRSQSERRIGNRPAGAALRHQKPSSSAISAAPTGAGFVWKTPIPFSRELWGRNWVFAHNGQLRGVKRLPLGHYRPIGTTDSEHAFCWLLGRIRERFPEPPRRPSGLWRCIRELAHRVEPARRLQFSAERFRYLYAHCSTQLSWLTRRAPFGQARLMDADMTGGLSGRNHARRYRDRDRDPAADRQRVVGGDASRRFGDFQRWRAVAEFGV